jgi:hypothetical protein
MAEETEPQLPVTYNGSRPFLEDFQKAIQKKGKIEEILSTEADKIAEDIVELETCIKYVQVITEQFRSPNSKLTKAQRAKFFITASLVSQVGTMTGLKIVSKCLGFREKVTIESRDGKKEKEGYDHTTVADMLNRSAHGHSLVQSNIHQMLHHIGLHFDETLFELRDKNGAVIAKDVFAMNPAEEKNIKNHLRTIAEGQGITQESVRGIPAPTIDEILNEEEGDDDDSE